jgi:hypothetical protein
MTTRIARPPRVTLAVDVQWLDHRAAPAFWCSGLRETQDSKLEPLEKRPDDPIQLRG